MLTSLNVLMPAGSAGSGEATEDVGEVVGEGGCIPEVACLPCIARVFCSTFNCFMSVGAAAAASFSFFALSLPVLTSLNVLMPGGSAASGEATEDEEGVVDEGGGNPEGACLRCIARVS